MKSNRKRNVARKAKSNRSQNPPSSNSGVRNSPPGAGSRKPGAGTRASRTSSLITENPSIQRLRCTANSSAAAKQAALEVNG